MDGIINVYKEEGWTSFDVVAKLRRITGIKKIGHTGTLDPAATGVLPVCIGKATRVFSLLTDMHKTYEAVLRLGVVTDTQDMTGRVLEERPVGEWDSELVRSFEEATRHFTGVYDQIPPMYSAKKQDGKKLYELARRGEEVERKPCRVEIKSIEIKEYLPGGRVRFEVTCSKGTYIRTLCQDMGERLGVGGCMESLLRTAVGPFHERDALRLGQIEAAASAGKLEDCMQPIDSLFPGLPSCLVDGGFEKALRNGNRLPAGALRLRDKGEKAGGAMIDGAKAGDVMADRTMTGDAMAGGGRIRVCLPDGSFAALYGYDDARGDYSVVKMFI